MKGLVIETSTESSIIALFIEGEMVGYETLGFSSSKLIMGKLQRIFQENGMQAGDLDWIAAGVGPGSYTGIRVGAVIGKTISFASGVPLIALTSLEGFIPEEEGTFAAIIDAKISGLYAQFGIKKNEKVYWSSEPEVIPLASERLRAVDRLITPNKRNLEKKIVHPRWIERSPDPLALYRVAVEKYHAGDYTLDCHLDLLYMRKTEAELSR